jgi:HEAT repeat protein
MPFIKAQKKAHTHTHNLSKKAKKISQTIRKAPFLKGITVIVMIQFMLLTMVEFQYTKAVQESVIERHEAIELTTYQPDSTLQVSLLNIEPLTGNTPENAHSLSIENDITKNLGLLTMIFSIGSLIVQILIASRLIRSIGVVGTLLLHPIVTILNLLGMTINFNFFTAAMGRSNFEITGKLFQNAYHSSYYAITENIRDHIKEFMEGLIKPLGTILAFISIYIIQGMAQGATQNIMINSIMILITTIMIVRIIFLKKNYTDVSYKNLETSNDLPTRLNALEILSQKGHKLETKTILNYLQNKKEKTLIKVKIIETLGRIQDPEAIPELINCLNSEHSTIRHAAIETLGTFEELDKHKGKKYAFTRHRLIETAKTLLHIETSSTIRSEIIQMLAKIDHADLIPFIINTMTNGDDKTKEACIKACRKFGDNNLKHYLEPYLIHKNQNVRAEAIVALWTFEKLKNNLNHYLDQMKKSNKKESILATLYILSETERNDEYPYIFKQLTSPDKEVSQAAAKALSKLNHRASILHIANSWIEDPETYKKFTKKLTREMRESIKKLVEQKTSQHINKIMKDTKAESLEELEIEELEQLKTAYETVDEHHEAFKIENLIQQKKKQNTPLIPQHGLAT